MDVVTIERDFVSWIAEKLHLTVDIGIFRGGIPVGVDQGVAVLLGSEVPSAGFYGFRPRTWNAQILAKYNDRDAAMTLLSCLTGLFPCPGFTHGATKFLSVSPRGSSEPYTSEDAGVKKTYLSFNVVLSVLTSGAQS
ncbi:MAG: hypothetical protein PHI85_04950 [Victivallaceae bacterium]|nr:hypothetical protein [Victivallaceae bacterium]